MAQVLDFSDDELKPVEIKWSEKYGCPIYKVGDRLYVGDTGEWGGYFDEVVPPTEATQERKDISDGKH